MLGTEVRFVKREVVLNQSRNIKTRTEEWVAPDLGCFPLQRSEFHTRDNLPEVLQNVRTVVSVSRDVPPASAMIVPNNYVERAPSAVYQEYNRRNPENPLKIDPRTAAQQDRSYSVVKEH
jgi:hypothetical protein